MDGVTSDLLTSSAGKLPHTAWREGERRPGEREKKGGGYGQLLPDYEARNKGQRSVYQSVFSTQGLDTLGTKTKVKKVPIGQ